MAATSNLSSYWVVYVLGAWFSFDAVRSIARGTTRGIKTGGVYARGENPGMFWFIVVFKGRWPRSGKKQ